MPDTLTFPEILQRLDDEICATIAETVAVARTRRALRVEMGEDVAEIDDLIARTDERIAAIQQERRHVAQ